MTDPTTDPTNRDDNLVRLGDEDSILDGLERDLFGAIEDPAQTPRPPTGAEESVSEAADINIVDGGVDTEVLDDEPIDGLDELADHPLGGIDIDGLADLEPRL